MDAVEAAGGTRGRDAGMLVEVPYREVAPFRTAAARERVSLSDTPATRWFVWRAPGAEDETAIIGCCGLLLRPGAWARIKGVYVRPPVSRAGAW